MPNPIAAIKAALAPKSATLAQRIPAAEAAVHDAENALQAAILEWASEDSPQSQKGVSDARKRLDAARQTLADLRAAVSALAKREAEQISQEEADRIAKARKDQTLAVKYQLKARLETAREVENDRLQLAKSFGRLIEQTRKINDLLKPDFSLAGDMEPVSAIAWRRDRFRGADDVAAKIEQANGLIIEMVEAGPVPDIRVYEPPPPDPSADPATWAWPKDAIPNPRIAAEQYRGPGIPKSHEADLADDDVPTLKYAASNGPIRVEG